MPSYAQTSSEPFRLEADGDSPMGIARSIAIVGAVPLVLGLLFAFAGDGEGEAMLLGLGLVVLGGLTALVGAFRVAAEQAARFVVVTQPRVLTVVEQGEAVRVHADKHVIDGASIRRVEIQRMVIPPAHAHSQPEERYFVALVTDHLLVELQMSALSDADHYAKTLGHRVGVEITARDRPMLPQTIGLAGAYLVLCVLGIPALAFWAMAAQTHSLVALTTIAGLVALQYPIGRATMRPTVRRWAQLEYGVEA